MTWASERQLIVFAVIGAILAVFAAAFYFSVFYRAPVCTDGVRNGKETGPDCGGTCPYLCTVEEEEATVLFTKAIGNGEGGTDVVALIENKNQGAGAREAPYSLTVYGFDQQLIQRVSGTVDLPPGATVPVFVSGIASGRAAPGTAFLTLDTSAIHWYALASDPRIVPQVSSVVITNATDAPRITATLTNSDVRAMTNVKAVVVVQNGSGNVIAASQTVLAKIPAQGSAIATFTWNVGFTDTPVKVQVLPVIPLPPPRTGGAPAGPL